jgi:hypothetical protein
MATYLNRTPSSASNRKTWTYSTWLKRSQIGTGDNVFFGVGAGTVEFGAFFKSDNILEVYQYTSGTYNFRYQTNQFFRDPSAWYHIVIACDTTQGSAGDRVKIYVNGSQITSFSTSTNPSQDFDTQVNLNTPHKIGVAQYGSGFYLGYMAQTILVDGTALTPSTFGSTNANGIWVPNTSPSVTYGTNGFKLDFAGTGTTADASGFGADSSGNGNHFASNSLGTNPSTSDTCQNNFSTLNPLVVTAVTFSEGNCKAVGDGGNYDNVASTIAFDITTTNGWYAEFKMGSNVNSDTLLGICKTDDSNLNIANASSPAAGTASTAVGMRGDGQKKINGSNSSYGSSYTTGDIMSIAVKGGAIYFYKNGTIQNSGTAAATGLSGTYYMVLSLNGSSAMQANFGNPSYTIASGNADANGYGNFEYAVPSGYYALCTKNLAAYGG